MKIKLRPGYKLTLLAMVERPHYNRRQLADFLNVDKTQLSATTAALVKLNLIRKERIEDTNAVNYIVLVEV